jgi:hypothetical protein
MRCNAVSSPLLVIVTKDQIYRHPHSPLFPFLFLHTQSSSSKGCLLTRNRYSVNCIKSVEGSCLSSTLPHPSSILYPSSIQTMLAPLLYLAFATVVSGLSVRCYNFGCGGTYPWLVSNGTTSIADEVATTIVNFAVTTKKVKVKGK